MRKLMAAAFVMALLILVAIAQAQSQPAVYLPMVQVPSPTPTATAAPTATPGPLPWRQLSRGYKQLAVISVTDSEVVVRNTLDRTVSAVVVTRVTRRADGSVSGEFWQRYDVLSILPGEIRRYHFPSAHPGDDIEAWTP